MYRYTSFPYLVNEKPELAKERLLDAMMEAQGNTAKAYANAGLSAFSWHRYLRILGLKEQMISLRMALQGKSTGGRYTDTAPTPKATSVLG